MRYLDVTKGLNKIGRLGENEHRTLRFGETAEDLAMYPDATVAVLHKRSGDAVAYPVPPSQVQIQSGVVCWTVMSGDLAMKGRGKVEVNIYQGNVIAKSYIYDTYVDDALDGSGDAPDPIRTFVQEVTEQAERAEAAAELLENPGAEAVTLAPGAPATAEYDDGTFRFGIPQGAKGDPGEPGEPGQDYVITPEDYDEIATEVATRQAIQGKVDAAEAAANEARNWADGKNRDGTVNPLYSENNGKFFAELAETATGHYPKIENGTWHIWNVQSETWTDTGVSATGSDGTDGVTFTPAVSADGVISWTNDGNRQNPQSINIPALVEGVYVETVSGTDPVITGVDNHRYVCGEIATLTITPPASGTIEVIFDSGTTPTVLTLPVTVLMPDWFDATALETDRRYDLMITDGTMGGVTSWALA